MTSYSASYIREVQARWQSQFEEMDARLNRQREYLDRSIRANVAGIAALEEIASGELGDQVMRKRAKRALEEISKMSPPTASSAAEAGESSKEPTEE